MVNYEIIELNKDFVTLGLNNVLGKEFIVAKKELTINDVRLLIDYILNYIEYSKKSIKDNETFGCGSWLLKFVFRENYIELHELKQVINNQNIYDYDVSISTRFLKEQLALNKKYNAKLVIPLIGQKIAISHEIYEGSEVNAVRYDAPEHMTGWYLTSNSYDGDVKSLSVDHLYHLLEKRPDLAKFLALPSGFRFFKDNQGEEVWLDED